MANPNQWAYAFGSSMGTNTIPTTTITNTMVPTTTTTTAMISDYDYGNGNNKGLMMGGVGTPGEEILKFIVKTCVDAALVEARAERQAEVEVNNTPSNDNTEGGYVDSVATAVTIFSTAAICYGAKLADSYAVQLYRRLNQWEAGMDVEQRGTYFI